MRAVLSLDERATYVHEGLDTAEIGCAIAVDVFVGAEQKRIGDACG